jgi:superfamily I DNA/RNA helicase
MVEGPLVIVAGPGSGKTRTLVHRILHLVTECGVAHESCLAITFTRSGFAF